ncbi:MAG: PCRF domain-containing protein [Candidatus Woesebacteria bacterium]
MSQIKNPYQAQIDEIENKIKESEKLLADPEFSALAQEEINQLKIQKQSLEQAAAEFGESTSAGPGTHQTSKSKAIIEIRAGAGGDEAKIWANDLLRMYLRFCESKGLNVSYIDDLVIKVSGKTEIKTVEKKSSEENSDLAINSNSMTNGQEIIYPFELFKYETGVHRVQRIPVTESQGRIHTSTASVAVLPEVPSTAITIKDEDLDWQFMRSSGAGGQSVNKTSSAVRLTHNPTGIVVVARQERKQAQNRLIALELLRSQLWEIEEEKKMKEIGQARSGIGRNMRAEKIRTYNFPQNRVTDHRINKSWYKLETILEGDLEEVVATLRAELEKQGE